MMLSFFITIPLLALILVNLPFRVTMKRVIFSLLLVLVLVQLGLVTLGFFNLWDMAKLPSSQFFNFSLGIDKLSLLLLLCNSIVILVAASVCRSFIPEGESRFNFICLLFIALAGTNGIALVRDIFSLYVFMEVTTIVSFILISFNKDAAAFEGAFKYIVLSSLATVLMLSGIALIFLVSGDTSFYVIREAFVTSAHTLLLLFAMGLFFCGLFIKAGLVPFHGWLADAYTASKAPVSIYLAGIATKALGVYTIMRLMSSAFIMGEPASSALLYVGTASVLVGALASLAQDEVKRLLSYSSISQTGYILLGFACGTPIGFAAAALHFFNHAVSKALLFVNAAAVEKEAGSTDMDSLGGLSGKMPVTSFTSLVAALSTAGVPPLAGFWSKLLVVIALWSSGHPAFAFTAALASIVTLTYMLTYQRRVFFGKAQEHLSGVKEAGWEILIPSAALAAIIVIVGILFPLNLCQYIIR